MGSLVVMFPDKTTETREKDKMSSSEWVFC